MSLLGKLMDTMRLSSEDDEDDYYLDDDFEDEAPRKGLFSKRNNTEPEDEPEAQDKPRFLGRSNPKVVPMRRNMEVTMIKPTSMDDSRDICDYLLSGKAVVLNMEGIHMDCSADHRFYFRSYLFYEWKPSENFQLYLYCYT